MRPAGVVLAPIAAVKWSRWHRNSSSATCALTAAGVYAEYLLSGVPFIFLSEEWQNSVAADHAELWRSPAVGLLDQRADRAGAGTRRWCAGCCTPTPRCAARRRRLRGGGEWVRHCRMWEPAIAAHRPRRRIYWLSIPLETDHRRLLDTVVGRDKDTDAALAGYRERAAELIGALPGVFFPKPVSAEQIWWHWNYTASRGVWHHPLPPQPYDPHASLPASAFTPVYFDPAAARLRGRRWRAARTEADVFVRTYRDADDGVPDSYQALIPLDSFPDTGIAWPRSTLFKVLDDLTAPDTTLDWTINTTFTSAESAVSMAQNVITNIRDQYRQRGRHADSDDELVRKLASGKELASELKRGSAERGVNPSIVHRRRRGRRRHR